MITILFTVAMLVIFGKILGLAIKATWSIFKIIFNIVILPITLIILVIEGLMYVAFPALIVIGLLVLFRTRRI